MTQLRNVNVKAQNSFSIDAFGRWRVSNPHTVFDSKQVFDKQPLFWDEGTTGAGTSSTYDQDTARTRLGVSNNTAGNIKRQTFMRFNYQSGKSQNIFMTARMSSAEATGIKACVGQFDDDNGLFFCMDGTTLKVVRRTNVTGTAVDNEVSQSAFNLDKMDGTGISGITIDPTKVQILAIDYEWLGSGRVRMGFIVGGVTRYVHEFLNANALTEVYMSTPNLPLRYELDNDGTGDATTMDHICSTVGSEGGTQDTGILRYKSTENTHVEAAADGKTYAVVGLRLKAGSIGAAITIESVALMEDAEGNFYEWSLVFNPTVAGTFTYSNETNSTCQTATGATANEVTGGTIITGGFGVSRKTNSPILTNPKNALRLGAAIDGTVDTIVLCVTPLAGSSNLDVHGAMTWREQS